MKYPTSVTLTLPAWLNDMTGQDPSSLPDPEERMRWVIGLSRRNVERAQRRAVRRRRLRARNAGACWAPASTASSR
ncbi:MAG: hypothetical protein MZV49_13635 [Rhodopseudomonas palustris]|nr:hypothetical protein [Rhodopseudomonas palustris]